MSETIELEAKTREHMRDASVRLGREGLIPAVVYGEGVKSKPIAVDRHQFELFAGHGGMHSRIVHLHTEGSKTPLNVMVREVQTHPLKGTIVHVDFLAVKMNKPIESTVQVHTVGESAGVKIGGVLMMNIRELAVEALPGDMPSLIEVDISALEIGDNLHVSDIVLPEGVTLKSDPEEIFCSVVTPQKTEEQEEAEAAAAAAEQVEPELVTGKPAKEE